MLTILHTGKLSCFLPGISTFLPRSIVRQILGV